MPHRDDQTTRTNPELLFKKNADKCPSKLKASEVSSKLAQDFF